MSDDIDTLNSTRKESLPLEAADAPAEPAKTGRRERQHQLLQRLAQLESVDAFKQYCNENNIPFAQREQLICDIYHFCGNEVYYDQLLSYADSLKALREHREALFPQPQAAEIIVPSSDIRSAPLGFNPQEPSPGITQGSFYASEESPVQPFWHSSEGNELPDSVWRDFVQGLCLLDFISKEQVPDTELLLGVSHKDEVLKHPIDFHGYKNQAALLFAMLYGTHAYELSQPLQADSAILLRLGRPPSLRLEPGLYRCPQLIMVPRGRGLNADGTTRDNYWDPVARALRFPRSTGRPRNASAAPGASVTPNAYAASALPKPSACGFSALPKPPACGFSAHPKPPACGFSVHPKPPADPAHSFVNALNTSRPLDPRRALPLLCLLMPLGLKRGDGPGRASLGGTAPPGLASPRSALLG